MPPIAAAIGTIAARGSRRSPSTISRLISRPTTKKKIAIRPSLIHASSVSAWSGVGSDVVGDHRSWYDAGATFAQISATNVAATRTTPVADSVRRNSARRRGGLEDGIGSPVGGWMPTRLTGAPKLSVYGRRDQSTDVVGRGIWYAVTHLSPITRSATTAAISAGTTNVARPVVSATNITAASGTR